MGSGSGGEVDGLPDYKLSFSSLLAGLVEWVLVSLSEVE